MKNYLCKLSMTAALISSFTFSAPLFALEDGVVKGSYINLRAEPKFNSKIVGKKVRGDSYKVKFEQQNWVKIVFSDGIEGWIYKTLVENSGTATDENSDTSDIDVKTNATATASDTAEIDKNKSKESAQVTAKKETANVKKDQKSEAEKPVLKQIKKEDVPEVMEVAGTAAELYDEAIKLYPGNAQYLLTMARLLWDKNEYQASVKFYKELMFRRDVSYEHFKEGAEQMLKADMDYVLGPLIVKHRLRFSKMPGFSELEAKMAVPERTYDLIAAGKVIKRLDGQVIINIGLDEGLSLSDEYRLSLRAFRAGELLTDPDTGKRLGRRR